MLELILFPGLSLSASDKAEKNQCLLLQAYKGPQTVLNFKRSILNKVVNIFLHTINLLRFTDFHGFRSDLHIHFFHVRKL